MISQIQSIILNEIIHSLDDKELNYLIQGVPKRIKGMVTLKESTPKNLRELTINKGLLEKNKTYTFTTILNDKFYNLLINDESIYDKLTNKRFEDIFDINLPEEALDFPRLSLYFLKNKNDEEISDFFGDGLSKLDILKAKINRYSNKNFSSKKKEIKNTSENSKLLKEIKNNKKEIRSINKINSSLRYELAESNKKIDELISSGKEKDKVIQKYLESKNEEISQIDNLGKKVYRLKNEIKLLKKEMLMENVLVIGELSQVIIDSYPTYKIVQTGKEINYESIQKELKKNYNYVFIIDFQINTRIKKRLMTNYSKLNFSIVKNINDFKLEV